METSISSLTVRMAEKAGKARTQIFEIGICNRHATTPHFQKPGFTLLELMVVIFIISLSVAIVFPSFYGLEKRALKSEAKRIASVLRYLNDHAISTKETCFLKFDLREGALSWEAPDGVRAEKFRSLASVALSSRGEIKEGQIIVFFGPLGTQENISVHLKGEDQGMEVTFNSLSGRVKILPEGG